MLWAARTPSDFVFDIEAFRLFTQHPTPVKVLPGDIKQNLSAQQKGKTNLYLKELPIELIGEIYRRFEQALIRRVSLERFCSNFPHGFSQDFSSKTTFCR